MASMQNTCLSLVLFIWTSLLFPCFSQNQNLAISISGPGTICAPGCGQYVATVTGNSNPPSSNTVITWLASDGTTNSGTSITFCANSSQIGSQIQIRATVVAIGPNGNQLVATDTIFVTILPQIYLNIISSNPAPCNSASPIDPDNNQFCEQVCPNSQVTYSVDSIFQPGTAGPFLQWSVSGAESFVVNNPPFNTSVTVNWGGPGSGSVTVFTQGIGGQTAYCGGESTKCVTVVAEPQAALASNPAALQDTIRICQGQTVYFENQSINSDQVEWLFGDDGSVSYLENPDHQYPTPGVYTVRLIARTNCLCADTTFALVSVLDAESAELSCISTLCQGTAATYTASGACPPYNWTVTPNGQVLNGGTPSSDSITVLWTGGPAGEIYVSATACSGASCPFPSVFRIPILSDNAQIEGDAKVCPGVTAVYSIEAYGGTNYIWSLTGGGSILSGQGTSSVLIRWNDFPSPSSFWLSVEYENCYLECNGKDSIEVIIRSPALITGPVEACEGANGNFSARLSVNGQPVTSNWHLFDDNEVQIWSSPGSAATVSTTFSSGGGYYRLFAVPANPTQTCTELLEWAVQVTELPVKPGAISGISTICPGSAYTYQALNTDPGFNVQWTIQNGASNSTANGNPINITWGAATPRWISARQITADALGCSGDTVGLVINAIGPFAIQGDSFLCQGSLGQYEIPDFGNLPIQWQINPATAGAISGGQGKRTVEIYWNEDGVFTLTATVCGQSVSFPVTVWANPVPTVTHTSGVCQGASAPVQTALPYLAYEWRNSSGTVLSIAPMPDLTAGSYGVVVSDSRGCTGAAQFEIAEYPLPNVSLTTPDYTGLCNNTGNVQLSALVGSGTNLTYSWFQNGIPLGVSGPVFSTNQYGNYTVVVTSPEGCSAISNAIAIFPDCGGGGGGGGIPGAGLPICPPGSVFLGKNATGLCDSFNFNASGPLYLAGSGEWFSWISGTTGILQSASGDQVALEFANAGHYWVLLQAVLTNGDTCRLIDSIHVNAVANFSADLVCAGDTSRFADESVFLPGQSITAWAWNYGDPASGSANQTNLQDGAHLFNTGGTYSVKLTITAGSGCQAHATQLIDIPEGNLPVFLPPSQNCEGNALEFSAVPDSAILQINWDFGDPGSGPSNFSSGTPAYHSFNTPGVYLVSAISQNLSGCFDTLTLPANVTSNTLSGIITPSNPAAICEGKSVTLQAPAGGVQYVWSDSLPTTTQAISVSKTGSYSVTITDANGCTYVPPPVNVQVIPAPDGVIKASLSNELGQIIGVQNSSLVTCFGEDVRLFISDNGAYQYQWSGGNGTLDEVIFSETRMNLLPVGVHTYSVTLTNPANGCTAVTQPYPVTVNPLPNGFSVSSNTVCAGDSPVLTYSGPQPPNWQIIWNTGYVGTMLPVDYGGRFFVRVINEFGCQALSNEINILPGPPAKALPSGCHTRCKPDTLCFPALNGITNWEWFLNGVLLPGITGPNLVAQQSGTYFAVLTDASGCTAQSDPLELELFDQFGSITGQVFVDVNNNNVLDGADTLISGIPLQLLLGGSAAGSGITVNGAIVFPNIPAANYTLLIPSLSLPTGFEAVIGSVAIGLSGCNGQASGDLLIRACTPVQDSLVLSACLGQTVAYNGIDLNPGSVTDFNFQTANGCDSTVTVTVIGKVPTTADLMLQACLGENAVYNGVSIPSGTSQNFVFTNAAGCDSIITVAVGVLFPTTSDVNLQACQGQNAIYQGFPVPAGTTQNFIITNAAGCDSIVTVTVTSIPPVASSLTLAACLGDAADYNGFPIPAGTTQSFVLSTTAGCDSIVTVTVDVLFPTTSDVTLTACSGQSAEYDGFSIPAGTMQNFVYTNTIGCDSIVTVVVNELESSFATVNLTACVGDSVDFNGTKIPAGMTQQFIETNFAGCDSAITVNVQALQPSIPDSLSVSVCPGENFSFNGVQLAIGDIQTFVLQNQVGCDSMVTLQVAAWPVADTAFSVNICQNETFVFQGQSLLPGVVQAFASQTPQGCLFNTTVTVVGNPVYQDLLEIKVCPGDTYLFNGVEVLPGETQTFEFSTFEGCDSIIIVDVSAFPDASFNVAASPTCWNDSTGILTAGNIQGGTAPFEFSLDGALFQSGLSFSGLPEDDYTVYMQDDAGCVFAASAEITARTPMVATVTPPVLPCGKTDGALIEVEINGDSTGLRFQWWNGTFTPSIQVFDPGPFWVVVENICDSIYIQDEVTVGPPNPRVTYGLVYIPNSFAPEGIEMENTEFRVAFDAEVTVLDFKIEIYDRWGNLMFTSNDPNIGWKGDFRGKIQDPGVFAWQMWATLDYCGAPIKLYKKGDVTVVR